MSDENKLTRRQLIFRAMALGGAQQVFANPVAHLMQMIVSGAISRAEAQALGLKPRKYVFIPLMGGPPRWTFTPLAPHRDDLTKMIANPLVNTRFIGGSPYSTAEYRTVNINNINWPWLWQFNVGRAGSGLRPMQELMNNLLIVRGIQAASAHGPAQMQRYHPMNIPYSFGSLVSDASAASIPAINVMAEDYRHISLKGKASVNVNPTAAPNVLLQLLDGLIATPKNFHSLSKGSLKDLLKGISNDLESTALTKSSGYEVSRLALTAAEETMERGFGDLGAVYNTLVNKYSGICSRTVAQTLVGINDMPIGIAPANRDDSYSLRFEGRIVRDPDLRSIILPGFRPGRVAENFALAEFALLNGLSDNITLGIANSVGMLATMQAGMNPVNHNHFDEHNTGTYPSLLANTFFNLCMGGCLLELMDRLKAARIFNEVVIDMSGEMGRNGRLNKGGSDHGGEGLDVAMWSGALPVDPQVVGDVLAKPPDSYRYTGLGVDNYPGSWGFGATNAGFGQLTLGHLASTQAHLLRVSNPVRSTSSVLVSEGEIYRSALPMGRIR